MDENSYKDFIDKQLEVAKESKRLNEGSPKPRPSRNPYVEAMKWQMNDLQANMQQEQSSDLVQAKTTILSADIHTSKTPFEELKAIKLRDMQVPMAHTGRYLVCKVIGKPCAIVGVNMLIQDLNGDVEELALYNFRYKMTDVEWIPAGTILIIKEPWLRYGAQSKIPSVRVDSPTDIIFVDPADEEFLLKIGATKWYEQVSKDAEIWRKKGNECFKDGKYEKAIFFYDRGIRFNPKSGVLYLNKALTYLRMDAYYQAYESAKLGMEKGGDREKAIFRMGLAAYGMREWKQACDHFVQIIKEFPENIDAPKEFKRATARLAEEKYGKFDFKTMLLESKKDKPNVDAADYVGLVKVANIPGKGRGIVATEDIKEGTLLVVAKAFGSGYDRDFPGHLFSINLIRKDAGHANQVLQVIDTMKKLQGNPQKAKEVYDLYSGPDSLFDERIPFGVIDAARIQKISALNRFASDDMSQSGESISAERLSEKSDNSHLFIFPSYFNHACYANAVRTFYNDVMVIRAAQDIKKDEEICLTYIYTLMDYAEKKKKLNSWKFSCDCKLCKADAADPLCSKRNKMFQDFFEYVRANKNSPQSIITKGERVLKQIRETYTKRKENQVVLAEVLILLAKFYFFNDNSTKCIKYLEELLTLMEKNPLKYGLKLENGVVNLAYCYLSNGNDEKFKEMIQKAMKLCFCEGDADHFIILYPHLAEYMSLI